jgi:hypothetical protein
MYDPINVSDAKKFYGLYRGIVSNNKDPEGHRRIKVRIPQLMGSKTENFETTWAWPIFPAGQKPYVPAIGEGVWIQFESGDPAYPVWNGTFGKNLQNNRHVSVEPLSNDIVTTNIEDLLTLKDRPDGTKEIDLTSTVVNLSEQSFYGSFYSTQTQNGGGGYAVTLNQTAASKGVSITNNSRVTFAHEGVFNIQFSAQLDKTDSGTDQVEFWFKENGTDVPWSNTIVNIDGNNAKLVAAWNYFVTVTTPGEYVELYWYSADTASRLYAQPAGARPGIPSIILTAHQVR